MAVYIPAIAVMPEKASFLILSAQVSQHLRNKDTL